MRRILRDSSMLCSVLFTAIALVFAVQIDYRDISGNLVPIACVALFLIAAFAEFIHRAKGAVDRVDWSVTGGLGLALFAGYLALIWVFGLLPATPVFVAAVFFCARGRDFGSIIVGVVFGVILAAAVYAVFVVGMGNVLPGGMFE